LVARSPEIEAVVRRYLHAVEEADLDAIRAMIDPGDHMVLLGSDPAERILGSDAVEFLVVAAKHRRKYGYNIQQIDAFEHGSVGWVALDALAEFQLDDSKPDLRYDPLLMRISATLKLDEGKWQIVQWHFSAPAPDDPAVAGEDLTAAMNEMIEAFKDASEVSDLTSRLRTNTVSLVFTDIVDSTVRAADVGDEAWTVLVTNHLEDIERITSQNDGIVVKTTGDGAMLAFSSARKAVHAAIAVRRAAAEIDADSPLRLRIGVHIGEAVKTDVDYFGQTVNEAARIMAAAEPDQILVSDLVRSLVGEIPELRFDSPLNLELKGIPEMRKAFPVVLAG
jgi:adenylate cyclase